MLKGILFDLDGTLADTAPDLCGALNDLCLRYQRPTQTLEQTRPFVSQGARGLIRIGFGIEPGAPYYEELRQEFMELYESRQSRHSQLFPGILTVLEYLDQHQIPWGIVTNKITRFTHPVLEQLGLTGRTPCIISGDTCARPKPYPDPLLAAAEVLLLEPAQLVYIGDDERDMVAAEAAGMPGLVALWGYLAPSPRPVEHWPALAFVNTPTDLLATLLPLLSLSR